MADTFTREQVAVKDGPKFVPAPDDFDPFNPTPTGEAKTPEPKSEAKTDPEPVPVKTEPVTPASDNSDDGSKTPATAESGTATSADPDGDTLSEPAEGAVTAPKRSEARERIEELVTERNALRKYGDYLLETIKQIQAAKEPPATTPPVAKDDPAPTLEQFEYDPAKYARAQNEWMQRQIDKGINKAVEQIQVQQSSAQLRANFQAKAEEFKKSKPDFDLVLSNPTLPTLHKDAAAEVIKSTNGPALAYHLAKNPDLAARIARMDALQQVMALGRIEAQITAEAQAPAPKAPTPPKTRTVTNAPPPPKPVESGTSVSTKPENLMSMDEWVARDRERKLAEKEARRKIRSAMR